MAPMRAKLGGTAGTYLSPHVGREVFLFFQGGVPCHKWTTRVTRTHSSFACVTQPPTPEDLATIEARMRAIIRSDLPFIRREISAAEARAFFADQPFKLELIDGLEHGTQDEHGNPLPSPPAIPPP